MVLYRSKKLRTAVWYCRTPILWRYRTVYKFISKFLLKKIVLWHREVTFNNISIIFNSVSYSGHRPTKTFEWAYTYTHTSIYVALVGEDLIPWTWILHWIIVNFELSCGFLHSLSCSFLWAPNTTQEFSVLVRVAHPTGVGEMSKEYFHHLSSNSAFI